MFNYMAAGLPIITTEFGTRGINNKNLFIISDIDDMPKAIDKYNINNYEQMILKSRKYVEENFDWEAIAEKLINIINKIL